MVYINEPSEPGNCQSLCCLVFSQMFVNSSEWLKFISYSYCLAKDFSDTVPLLLSLEFLRRPTWFQHIIYYTITRADYVCYLSTVINWMKVEQKHHCLWLRLVSLLNLCNCNNVSQNLRLWISTSLCIIMHLIVAYILSKFWSQHPFRCRKLSDHMNIFKKPDAAGELLRRFL